MTDRDDSAKGFLERWSRKKIDAERGVPEATPEPAATEAPASDDAASAERRADDGGKTAAATTPKPEFDLASLPSLDSITAATDIRPFLGPGVPTELARAALRRAWTADPAIREFVGLAENAWDFTDPNAMPGFGELPPGYDVKKLLAQIFSEGEKPAEPEAAADKPAEPQSLHNVEEIAAPMPPAEAAPSPEIAESSATKISSDNPKVASSDFVQRDNNIASHKSIHDAEPEERKARRPHGGALPQ
jgi:hypothetical protein